MPLMIAWLRNISLHNVIVYNINRIIFMMCKCYFKSTISFNENVERLFMFVHLESNECNAKDEETDMQ